MVQDVIDNGRRYGMNGHPCIDAYAHVGIPRFGSVEQLISNMDIHGIAKSAAVLGPLVPDMDALLTAMRRYPDRIRGIGITFGAAAEQRIQLVELQLEAGALGIRMGAEEALDCPGLLKSIGERKRWIYGIDPCRNEEVAGQMLGWLEKYPDSRLVAPHFLKAGFAGGAMGGNADELLRHPHFYAIFSRHGAMDSRQSYPHEDFLPWMEHVLRRTGWQRTLWGSEYPVLYWRNETIDSAREWIRRLIPGITEEQLRAFLGGNAQRLLFDAPPPLVQEVEVPGWVEEQFDRPREVPFFYPGGISLPSDLYRKLLDNYMEEINGSGMPLGDYLLQLLKERLS